MTFKDLISAFAIHELWGALGWVIAYGYSPYLCTGVKLYILMAMLFVSVVGYYLVEYWCRKEKREMEKEKEISQLNGVKKDEPESGVPLMEKS